MEDLRKLISKIFSCIKNYNLLVIILKNSPKILPIFKFEQLILIIKL